MAYQYMITADIEEGFKIKSEDVYHTNVETDIPVYVKELSTRFPTATICVYSLSELHKLKTRPEYQKYKVSNGEVLPV